MRSTGFFPRRGCLNRSKTPYFKLYLKTSQGNRWQQKIIFVFHTIIQAISKQSVLLLFYPMSSKCKFRSKTENNSCANFSTNIINNNNKKRITKGGTACKGHPFRMLLNDSKPSCIGGFQTNSHWLQLIRTNHRTGSYYLPERWLLCAWPRNFILCTDLFHQRSALYYFYWHGEQIIPLSQGCRSLWGLFQSSKPTQQVWIQAWGSQDLLGQATMPKKSQWLRLFASTWLFSGIPVLQPFTHVCNFPPASPGIKKPWDALQNNPFGALWFCSVTVSISVFSSFNIMVRFISLLNTSLNSYAMSQFRGFKSSIETTPRLESTGPQRRC